MSSRLPLLALVLPLAAARAAGPSGAAPAAAGPLDGSAPLFSQLTEDYKRPVDVPNSFFNPFKIQAGVRAGDDRRDTAVASDGAVRAALSQRGLSGVVFDHDAAQNRAIIGNQVFAVGDELQFVDDSGKTSSLVPNATVILRAISATQLTLDVATGGEAPHPVTYSLHTFLQP